MGYVSGYYRGHAGGSRHYVNGHQSGRESRSRPEGRAKPRLCPVCGARIRTRGMRSGKLVTYEADDGLTWVRHFCAHVGEGLSRTRDAKTLDLFSPDVPPPPHSLYSGPPSVAPP